ncbi:hypothetical protein BH11BAC2_BH11BAC2_04220 [soil metagenome]
MKLFQKHILVITLGVIGLFAFNGCYYDNQAELHPGTNACDTAGTISYATRIAPIMTSRCGAGDASCHKGDASSSAIGLDTYDGVSQSADNTLIDAIVQNGNVSNMPKGGGKLDDCSIALIQIWINQSKPQ